MKTFICFVTLLASMSVFANDNDASQPSHAGLIQSAKLAKTVQTKAMEDLSNEICAQLISAQEISGENSAKVVERMLLAHLHITKQTPNYKTKLTTFWNKNLNQFICTDRSIKYKFPQHLMKRVIDMRLDRNVYFNFIFDLDENVQVNAVEIHNGKPETVIDYIDAILADPNNKTKYVFREIKDLREVLIDYYGAKRASEL